MERLNVIPILVEEIAVPRRPSRTKKIFSDDAFQSSLKEGTSDGFSDIRKRFETFDAKTAKCYNPEEREKLLAVIQSGFGSLDAFNMLVSGLFEQSVVRTSLKRGSSKKQSLFQLGNVVQTGIRRTSSARRRNSNSTSRQSLFDVSAVMQAKSRRESRQASSNGTRRNSTSLFEENSAMQSWLQRKTKARLGQTVRSSMSDRMSAV